MSVYGRRADPVVVLLLLLVCACSGGGGGGGTAEPATTPTPAPTSTAPFLLDETTRSLARPAVATSVSAAVLECTVTLHEDEACTFNDLPLLGMTTDAPGVEEIMARVVVTHAWMGDRFRQLLQIWPPEILLMMRGLTAIVISSEIRPSFYTARTGAIYLDPLDLAISDEERATVSTDPDPRIDDIQQFKFLILWRYVFAGQNLGIPSDDINIVRLQTASLLFHELAHANDFFPPESVASIDRTVPVYRAFSTVDLPSTQLSGLYPLANDLMKSLAQVAFRGSPPTASQLALTADDIAMEFPFDIANDYYNYSSQREDFAMAFEESMMLYALGIPRDVGIVDFPPGVEFCDDLLVAWGQRRRIVDPSIRPRAEYAVQRILPEASAGVSATLDGWTMPEAMVAGNDWCTNISLGPPAVFAPAATLSSTTTAARAERRPWTEHGRALVPYL